jgi:hypothetical protein
LKPQLLPITATAVTALALLSATSIPVLGTNDDLRNLAIGAAIILWLVWRAERNHRQASETRTELAQIRTEVDEIRRLSGIEDMLRKLGYGSAIPLPTPPGDIRPVPTDVDGETVLVGIDEHATLGTLLEFRRAMSDGDGRVAQ